MPKTTYSEELLTKIASNEWQDPVLDLSASNHVMGEHFYLDHTHAEALAKAMETNTFITTLKMRNQSLGDKGAIVLAKTKLNSIDLTNNEITEEGCLALAVSDTITCLCLSDSYMGNKAAEAFGENKKLKSLDLFDSDITDEGGEFLVEKNTSLEQLNLGGGNEQKIGKKTIVALAKNKTLRSVSLAGCEIGDDNAKILLEGNKTLTFIDLSYNNLNNEIIPYVVKHPTLTGLNLSHNKDINDKGGKLLQNTLLISLDISSNNVSDPWEGYLQNRVKQNNEALLSKKRESPSNIDSKVVSKKTKTETPLLNATGKKEDDAISQPPSVTSSTSNSPLASSTSGNSSPPSPISAIQQDIMLFGSSLSLKEKTPRASTTDKNISPIEKDPQHKNEGPRHES